MKRIMAWNNSRSLIGKKFLMIGGKAGFPTRKRRENHDCRSSWSGTLGTLLEALKNLHYFFHFDNCSLTTICRTEMLSKTIYRYKKSFILPSRAYPLCKGLEIQRNLRQIRRIHETDSYIVYSMSLYELQVFPLHTLVSSFGFCFSSISSFIIVFFLATWSSSGSSSSLCSQDTVYNIIIIKRRIFCMLRQTR